MSAHNQKSAFPSYYHDTWTLLKNYRSVSWSIEVSDYNLQAEFRTEYGCASEAVLDGLEASNSNTHLESYVHSLERSKRMLQLINSAIDLMRKKHEKGELYYWILYYTYLAPHHYANNYEILHFLELKGMPMSMRNYYLRREEAINVLSSVLWGYTSTDCEELICDDDPTFAQSMFKRILSLPAYSSKSMKLSCLTDIAEMSANTIAQYDILFLDIDLGKESGIDLARKMRKMNPEAVLIFVTNFSEYAPEGYEVDAFRYLAKSELEKKLPTYFEDALAMCRTRQRKVEILCEGESVPIPVQSLAWIESQGREQYLHLVGGCREQLITRLTITQLEDLLVPHGFLRIHKSYLVNMAYLQSFQSTSAVLTIGQALPVGARSYRDNKQKFVRWQAQQLW